jgi:hypothetical protein
MNKTRVMKAAFDPKRHLENCLGLPPRNPVPYYRPDRKRVPPYISDICVLRDHADEVEKLKESGVPPYLAQVMVLVDYAHTAESIERRVKEATGR